ncbi:uncharacterized protein LOC135200649 [Macrobrachium nipponense]|uniref:uncharacterized protein LOC135200649 n=1 Tax=Macrobrachium nipponense TaxID=159736 RepID=UPI0030C8A8D6
MRDDIRDLKQETRDMWEENRDLRHKNRDLREDIRDLRDDSRDLREDNRDLREEIRDLREEIRHFRKEIRHYNIKDTEISTNEISTLEDPLPPTSPPEMPLSDNSQAISQQRNNKTFKECKEAFPPTDKTQPEITKQFIENLRCLGIPLVCIDSVFSQGLSFAGEGAFAKCYRYQFADLDKPVIIKVIENLFTPTEEILKEVTMLQRVADIDGTPCVLAVSPMEPYAVIMEDGGNISFSDWMIKKGRLPREGLEMLKKISQVLAQIHLKQVVHTDLHEKNIVIDEERNQPTIVDFGRATDMKYENQGDDVLDLYLLLERCSRILKFPSHLKEAMNLENMTLPKFVQDLNMLLDILDKINKGPEKTSERKFVFMGLEERDEAIGNKIVNLKLEESWLLNLLEEFQFEWDNLEVENAHLKQLAVEAKERASNLKEISAINTTSNTRVRDQSRISAFLAICGAWWERCTPSGFRLCLGSWHSW